MTEPIKNIQDRLEDLKKELGRDSESKKSEDHQEKSDLGRAYELIATPIVCGGIGIGIDYLAGTGPFFFITLAFLGVLAGFWAIYKSSQNIATPLDSKRLQDDQKQAKQSANFEENGTN
ncbi:MAG TPA: AtpZ/AtpI family protein [Alphaproteobacteria bacterium]|nr:AtpZ/AtpI family protein [Alphaproteobacteria bacterium]HOO49836.1 AtpZ/AtpI family protein [Alphaproteobacteria bacterium]